MDYQDPDIPLAEKVTRLENDPEEFEIVLGEYDYTGIRALQDILAELAVSPQINKINK